MRHPLIDRHFIPTLQHSRMTEKSIKDVLQTSLDKSVPSSSTCVMSLFTGTMQGSNGTRCGTPAHTIPMVRYYQHSRSGSTPPLNLRNCQIKDAINNNGAYIIFLEVIHWTEACSELLEHVGDESLLTMHGCWNLFPFWYWILEALLVCITRNVFLSSWNWLPCLWWEQTLSILIHCIITARSY